MVESPRRRAGPVVALDHVGVATADLERLLQAFTETFDLQVVARERNEGEMVEEALVAVGGQYLQFLEGTASESVISRFIGRRGAGLHHVALRVDHLDAAVAHLQARGLRLLGPSARRGAAGSRTAFLDPRDLSGVLIELVERPSMAAEG
jgi:methylmalonyl-CoA/ethylmalonyl-CoA epimerase